MGDAGKNAEAKVQAALREALSGNGYHLYFNVDWTGPVRDEHRPRDGEADVVITHPKWGLLVIEVKAGEPRADARGRWYIGDRRLRRSPVEQAKISKHALVRKLKDLPKWPSKVKEFAGHAVAFPDASAPAGEAGAARLGPDIPPELVLDAEALRTAEGTRRWVDGAFAYWAAGTNRQPLEGQGVHLVDELLGSTRELRTLLDTRIESDRVELVKASDEQLLVLDHCRCLRRIEVVGPAGCGKSLLAVERARRLAGEDDRTLLVCFNSRLAASMQRELRGADAPSDLRVTTFHRLCEQVADALSMLPERPDEPDQSWWDDTLPTALASAIEHTPARYDAVVVDEGQDFDRAWLETLQRLLRRPEDDWFWVFHDPAQALRGADVVGDLGLERIELFENHRNPATVAEVASGFRSDDHPVRTMSDRRSDVVIVEAEPGSEPLMLNSALARIRSREHVAPEQIAVLSGRSAYDSQVWKTRKYGPDVLANAAINDDGTSRRLPSDRLEPEPEGTILFETIRRFKGLEREVVIALELPDEGPALDELMYVAITRATTHLTIIAPPALAERLRSPG